MSNFAASHSASLGGSTAPNFRWWIPAQGISRQIIQAEIQRYLGPDALVKPGKGKDQYENVNGYWISAYRNLTSAMTEDLKNLTARAEKEREASSRFQEPAHHDPRHSGHGPTPPLAHTQSAYAPPHAPSPYGQEGGYPPPRAGSQIPPPYPAGQDPREHRDHRDPYYAPQQPPYGGHQPSVSPSTQYASHASHGSHGGHPHFNANTPVSQPQTGAFGYPSPPPTQYPQHAYPTQVNPPRQGQYPPGYSQPPPQGYSYASAPAASAQHPGYQYNNQANGQYQYR